MQALVATLRCPISGGIMHDPVILRCSGVSYERSVLEAWIEVEGTDPGTPCARQFLNEPSWSADVPGDDRC